MDGPVVMQKKALTGIVEYAAPLLRLGALWLTSYVVAGVGLIAMMAFTVPEVRKADGTWLSVMLWVCLAYFLFESVLRFRAARLVATAEDRLLTSARLVDVLMVLPVPIALVCGAPPETAWLLASLWVLKLAQDSPGFAQLGRVFVMEAKPLASVFALFLIILFLASVAMHLFERDVQPIAFGSLPGAMWWAVVTLTTTGYGDVVPQTMLGHLLGGVVMICGIATFGLWTGILATGFAAESRRRNFIQTWDLVSKVPFFQMLDPAAITEITHLLRRVEMPTRLPVIRRGKTGDCMYFIAEGEVEVDVAPVPVRLGPGAFFGELALLGNPTRTANVITTQPSTLLVLDLADFRTFTAHHPELASVIEVEARRRRGENERRHEDVFTPGGFAS
jgi:voltage-gated potassium channel